MKRSILTATVVALLCVESHAATVEAFNNATIQPGGPRTGSSGKSFFNIEGSDNASFSSYGVARFDLTAVKSQFDATFGATLWTIDSVTLQLTQSNAGFTNDGPVSVHFTGNDSTSIEPGVSTFAHPFAGDFPDAAQVMSYVFAEQSTGAVESYVLFQRGSSNSVGGNAIVADMLNDANVTLLFSDDSASVAATYAGFSHSSLAGPTLVITAAPVPEPETYALLLTGLALVGLARRGIKR